MGGSSEMFRLFAILTLFLFSPFVRAVPLDPPRLDPAGPYVVGVGGQSISLTCKADDPVFWMIDNLHSEPLYEDFVDEDTVHSVSLHMTNLSYTDVGYFYCAYNTSDNLEKVDVAHSLVASIYLFVRDDYNLMSGVTLMMAMSEITAIENETLTVPCKGAFPEVDVSVTLNHVKLVGQEYDYFKGVTFRVEEEGFYQCDGYYKGQTSIHAFYVRLQKDKDAPPEPPSVELSSYWQKRTAKVWTQLAAAGLRGADSWSGSKGRHTVETLAEVEEFDVVGGSDVNLTCSYHYHPSQVTLQWKRLQEEENKALDAFSTVMNEEGSTHVDIRLRKVNKTLDEGDYACEAQFTEPAYSNSETQVSMHRVHLNVLSSPYLKMKAENPVIREGLEHDLSVRWQLLYHAFPDPDFAFFRNGIRLLKSIQGRDQSQGRYHLHIYRKKGEISLEVETVAIEDVGEYTFEAELKVSEEEDNEIAPLRQVVNLTLLLESSPFKVHLDVRHLQQQSMTVPGKTHAVECRADAFPPPHFVLEFAKCLAGYPCQPFQDLQVGAIGSGALGRVTVSGHHSTSWSLPVHEQGLLRCRVRNKLGSELSDVVRVMVADGPSVSPIAVERVDGGGAVVAEGENVTLRCFANAMATSGRSVVWARRVSANRHASTTPATQAQSLVMSQAVGPERRTGGANETSSILLSARRQSWAVSSTLPSASKKDKERWQVLDGHEGDVSLSTWHSNYSTVHEIVLHNVTTRDSGLYACIDPDSDQEGQDSSYRLNVKQAEEPRWATPDGSPTLPLLKQVNATSPLTLHCLALGVPVPNITWFKNGEPLLEPREGVTVKGGKLNFSFVRSSDAATYSCKAFNGLATIWAQTKLQVLDSGKWDETLMKIFVVVLGCIVLPFSVGCLVYKPIHRQHRRLKERKEDQRAFEYGDPSSLNPDLCVGEQADLLPYDSAFEVPRRNVQFERLLGAGEFGRVYQARVDRLLPGQRWTTVAVKTIRCRSDKTQIKALRSELKIMVHIGRHINIVNLLGACSRDVASKGELLLIVEFCRLGCLLDYLRKRRKDFVPEHLDGMREEEEEEEDDNEDKSIGGTEAEDEEEEGEESESEDDVRAAEDSGDAEEEEGDEQLALDGPFATEGDMRREDGGSRGAERRRDVMHYLKHRKKHMALSNTASGDNFTSCIKYAKLQFEEDLSPTTSEGVLSDVWVQVPPTQEEVKCALKVNECFPQEQEASSRGIADGESEGRSNTPSNAAGATAVSSTTDNEASYSSEDNSCPAKVASNALSFDPVHTSNIPKDTGTTSLGSHDMNNSLTTKTSTCAPKDSTPVPNMTTSTVSTTLNTTTHPSTPSVTSSTIDVLPDLVMVRDASSSYAVGLGNPVGPKDAIVSSFIYSEEDTPAGISVPHDDYVNSARTASTVDINVRFDCNQDMNKNTSHDKITGFHVGSQATSNLRKNKRKGKGKDDKEKSSGKEGSVKRGMVEGARKKRRHAGEGTGCEGNDKPEHIERRKTRRERKDEGNEKNRKKRAKTWLGKEKGTEKVERKGGADGPEVDALSSKDLLCWAFQIARGMEYLAHRKVLHGDLAARNLLLADNNIVKISDFGLSRDLYRDHYRKRSRDPLPIKWLSIEALRDRIFSTQSDVWSFGVVLWELFTLGATPYPGIEVDELFLTRLQQGMRLTCPTRASQKLYRLMQDCWREEPMLRPSFRYMEDVLGYMLGRHERQYYLTLDEHCTDGQRMQHQGESCSGSSDGGNDGVDFLANIRSPDFSLITASPSVPTPRFNDAAATSDPAIPSPSHGASVADSCMDVGGSPRPWLSSASPTGNVMWKPEVPTENMGYVVPRGPPLDMENRETVGNGLPETVIHETPWTVGSIQSPASELTSTGATEDGLDKLSVGDGGADDPTEALELCRLPLKGTELLSFIKQENLTPDYGCPRELGSQLSPLHHGTGPETFDPLQKVMYYNSFDSPGVCSQHNPYYSFIHPSLMTDENNYLSREEVDKCVGRGRDGKNDEEKDKHIWKEKVAEEKGNDSTDSIESQQKNSGPPVSTCHSSTGNSKSTIGNSQQWSGNSPHYSENYQLHQGNSTRPNLTQLPQGTVHYVNLQS